MKILLNGKVMSFSQFTPKISNQDSYKSNAADTVAADPIASKLAKICQGAVVALFFFVPVYFSPGLWASLGFDKVLITSIVTGLIAILVCLTALRLKSIKTVIPWSLLSYWTFVALAFVSAIVNGDMSDSIRGASFEVQTVGFLVLCGVVMTSTLVLQGSKTASIKAVLIFGVSAALLVVYNLIRIFFDADFLSSGSFNTLSISPIGSFNDLAVISGLTLLLSLLTLVQLPLRRALQAAVSLVALLSLLLLAVINFINIWLVVGFFSLLMLVYLLSRSSVFMNEESDLKFTHILQLSVAGLVCAFSLLFIVSGTYADSVIDKFANVDYVEVVPSTEGTLGVARNVLSESSVFGIGPNRFSDAWRLYKDPLINETVFWDTDFDHGSSFVSTLVINVGLLPILAFVVFQMMLIYLGYRTLVKNAQKDPYWFYISSVSALAAVFIWGMSYLYEPGAAVLIIGSLFTGLLYVSARENVPNATKTVNLVSNQKRGFLVMALAILFIIVSAAIIVNVWDQYQAQAKFNESQTETMSAAEFELVALKSFNLHEDDRFLRTIIQLKLAEINDLIVNAEPTEASQQKFLLLVGETQSYAEQALKIDPTNPDNYALSAAIYRSLALAGVVEASEKMTEALEKAVALDPTNPGYALVEAQVAVAAGDFSLAQEKVLEAVELKPNYTEAIFLSAQIDINQGNTLSAISKTRSIISLEPNNPTRYFQLGMLLSSQQDYIGAVSAFSQAVSLDSEYANARYLLALALVELDDVDGALSQLRTVLTTNPDNLQLKELIRQIEAGEVGEVPELGYDTPVLEEVPLEDGNQVTSDRSDETDLVDEINSTFTEEAVDETEETDGE